MKCKVFCRIRPFKKTKESKELLYHHLKPNLNIPESLLIRKRNQIRTFFTNKIFWMETSQKQVFDSLWNHILETTKKGKNSTILAYGYSGTGKTYTMMGDPNCNERQGLIPRIIQGFLTNSQIRKIQISYLEIYNDRVMDLLSQNPFEWLKVREHPENGLYVEDLSRFLVTCLEDAFKLLNMGTRNRTTAQTELNVHSSRSHCILTIFADVLIGTSRIHLVDLAGSERVGQNGLKGIRLKESLSINCSLSSLGKVLNALANGNSHIPYRNSTLTWLLKDSIGGCSFTSVVATISPEEDHLDDAIRTLRYAEIIQKVETKVNTNSTGNQHQNLLEKAQKEIEILKNELEYKRKEVIKYKTIYQKTTKEQNETTRIETRKQIFFFALGKLAILYKRNINKQIKNAFLQWKLTKKIEKKRNYIRKEIQQQYMLIPVKGRQVPFTQCFLNFD